MCSDAVDPDAVAAAALGCADVVALAPGSFGEVATYLPGRQVSGVRIADGEVEVHIVARWGPPLPTVADHVRHAVRPLSGGRLVNVVVDDVRLSQE